MYLIMTVNGIHMQLQLTSTKEHIIKQGNQGVDEMEETTLADTHNLTKESYTFCSSNQACAFLGHHHKRQRLQRKRVAAEVLGVHSGFTDQRHTACSGDLPCVQHKGEDRGGEEKPYIKRA